MYGALVVYSLWGSEVSHPVERLGLGSIVLSELLWVAVSRVAVSRVAVSTGRRSVVGGGPPLGKAFLPGIPPRLKWFSRRRPDRHTRLWSDGLSEVNPKMGWLLRFRLFMPKHLAGADRGD